MVASANETTNNNAAISADYTFTIDKANQSITFGSLPTGKIVGDANFAPGATSATSGTNAITYTSSDAAVATIVSSQIHIVGAGTCTIYADQALSDNYNAASQASRSLTVDGGQTTISIVAPKTATEVLTNSTADVALSSTLTMDVDKSVNNVTVSAAGTIDLPTSKVLTVNGNLDLKANLTSSFSVNLGSSSISVPTGVVRYLKTIDDQKWYFISFPCNVDIASIKESNGSSLGTLGINWFIKYYNGQRRANNGADGSNWISIAAADLGTTPNLLANVGYIIGLGTNTGASKEIAFPLDKAILSGEAAKTSIPVSANTATSGTATISNYGWNLVGQPYISKFDVAGAGVPYIYFVKAGGSGYDYYLPSSDGTRIENPFGAYFVQSSGNTSINFNTSSRQSVRSSVASNVLDNLQLNFSSVSGTDRTNIVMDNTMSSAYVIGQDLEKWFGSSAAVYTVLGGINYALNGLPMISVVNLPLGVYSINGGAATISASATNAPSLSKLILTDNVLHTTTNLLEKDYTYTATSGTDNTRFQITAQRVVTDINMTGYELGETQLLISNSKLMINNLNANAIVRVYDALGRMLVSKAANSNVMEIKLNVRGIYTVQLQLGTTISTRKVIF